MGAYYFPWISMYDAVQDKNVYAPPSGGICGIYGRVDGTRGVHKAPANEIFRTALGLKYNLTDAEQELLNPKVSTVFVISLAEEFAYGVQEQSVLILNGVM